MGRSEVEAALEGLAEGYRLGVSVAGARLVGVVAARLGDQDPILIRMIEALGQLAEAGPPTGSDREKPPAPA